MPYSAAQTMADAFWPHNFQNYWKSDFLNGLSDGAIDTIVQQFSSVPSSMTSVVIEHNGDGAMNDIGRNETAFWHRDSTYNLLVTSMWEDRRNAEENVSRTKDFVGATARFASGGVYVNYLGEEGSGRIRSAFGSNFDRLSAVKQKYDPENAFRLNQNIEPAD
ncbi:BBE domain-containing protein [Pseudonocardia halophobica]|uniref:BBE domain-containing protein n=1 Tax=Pseudonocardia halophobica TaxID=29401 RepID=UPI003D9337E3